MSVLAIVAKNVFEKDARVGGKLLGAGEVWPAAGYASASPALARLSTGGSLYLVTVRPGDRLWLVAVLRSPTCHGGGWTAPANAIPIRDISALRDQLRFASGKGLTADPGKLARALQTPRALAAGDIAALEAAIGAGPAAEAAGITADVTPGLELASYRRRKRWSSMTATERKTLAAVADELATAEEDGEDTFELLDVRDPASAAKVYLFALWPFGSGVLVDVRTRQVVADVAQHHFAARGDDRLRQQLGAAWERQREALGVRETVSFAPGAGETTRPTPPVAAANVDTVLARIEAMRAAVRQGARADASALWALVTEAIDLTQRRLLPLRRLFELDETTRAALELIHEGYDPAASMLINAGLPPSMGSGWRKDPTRDPGDLARFLGHAPRGPLDQPVAFGGAEHPAWALLSDALFELRSRDEVLSALASLAPASATALVRALALSGPRGPLCSTFAKPPAGAQLGSPTAVGAHAQRYLALVLDLAQQLEDGGVGVAEEILAARADWIDRWLPQLTARPDMGVPYWFEQCAALALLARAATRSGAALDPRHDPRLAALASYHDATYPLAVVLAELPADRAARIARADLGLIERFPAAESTTAAIERLEASGGGPYMEALFRRVITAIGAPAASALEAAIQRDSSQKRVLVRCLGQVRKS